MKKSLQGWLVLPFRFLIWKFYILTHVSFHKQWGGTGRIQYIRHLFWFYGGADVCDDSATQFHLFCFPYMISTLMHTKAECYCKFVCVLFCVDGYSDTRVKQR